MIGKVKAARAKCNGHAGVLVFPVMVARLTLNFGWYWKCAPAPPRRQDARIILLILGVLGVLAVQTSAAEKPYLLHLPGIGGHRMIDDRLIGGLMQGALDVQTQIYDWTHGNFGIPALASYQHNRDEAQKISDLITKIARDNPDRRIIVTSHSGGGAMAIWALEKLPDDVRINTLLMVAPAISPQYDLSKALRHVRGRVYSLNSVYDPILSFGTRNLGTMDRILTESAGYSGFVAPPGADAVEYAKLTQVPYDISWMQLGNAGDHIGAMNLAFARIIIAPLLLTGELPKLPATQPSTQPFLMRWPATNPAAPISR